MLHYQNGIITDDSIAGVPFERAIIAADANPHVRTGIPLRTIRGITTAGDTAPSTAPMMAASSWVTPNSIGANRI